MDTTTTPPAPATPASPVAPVATIATPSASPTAAPTERPSGSDFIAAASRKLRESAGTDPLEAQRTAAAGIADDDAADPPLSGSPSTDPSAASAVSAPSIVKGEDGKWRRTDGTFASTDEIAAAESQPATTDDPSAAEPKVFTLKGDSQRGESDLDLDVEGLSDEQIERLNRLANDGMRASEFRKRLGGVEEREAKVRAFTTALSQDPVNLMLDHLPQDIQLPVMKALMLANWEPMLEILRPLVDASNLKIAQLEDRHARSNSRVNVDDLTSRELEAVRVWSSVELMVPETASTEDRNAFLRDADRDLADEVRAGRPVTVDAVQKALERRRRQYGFQTGFQSGAPAPNGSAPATPAVPAVPPGPPKLAVARPKQGSDAEAIAQRAAEQQKRTQRAQQTRTIAAAVAPAGAGALPVEREKPPKGLTIEQASKWQREQWRKEA